MGRSTTLLAAIALIVGGVDVAAAQEGGSCTPAPRTGCLQSDEVELRVSRSPERINWRWHGEAPSTDGDFGLCLYDGERTAQTEAAAPAPDTDSLILGVSVSGIEADDEALSTEVVAEDSWLAALRTRRDRTHRPRLGRREPDYLAAPGRGGSLFR